MTHPDDKTIIRPDNERLHIAITYADLVRLIAASIAAPADLHFGIFHGVSNNRWKGIDLSDTRAILGYDRKIMCLPCCGSGIQMTMDDDG